jgi:ferredoxin-NADP reductase
MLRHHAAVRSSVPARLVYSSRSYQELIYREELASLAADSGVRVFFTLTREWPEHWSGHRRRIDEELLSDISWAPQEQPLIYICGPTAFVERGADILVMLGHDPARVKTERFGPTG